MVFQSMTTANGGLIYFRCLSIVGQWYHPHPCEVWVWWELSSPQDFYPHLSQLADSDLVGTQGRAVSRAQWSCQWTTPYFTITKPWVKENTPFLPHPSWCLAHYPSPCHSEPQRIIWKIWGHLLTRKRKIMCRYNGLKCRCHYVQCLMVNEYSDQHRLHSSFYVPALFANSHGCTLLYADT